MYSHLSAVIARWTEGDFLCPRLLGSSHVAAETSVGQSGVPHLASVSKQPPLGLAHPGLLAAGKHRGQVVSPGQLLVGLQDVTQHACQVECCQVERCQA